MRKFIKIVSLLLCVSIISCGSVVYAADTSKPDAVGDEVHINFLFAFFREEPSISSKIKSVFWYKRNVKVLDYSGNYVYVRDIETNEKGFIHELLINDKAINIVQEYLDVYNGKTKEKAITVNIKPNSNLEWSLSKNGIVEVTKHSEKELTVTGLSSGMVTLTVKSGGDKDTCIISCVEKWYETEMVTAEKTIQLMGSPGTYYDDAPTVSKGSSLIARGNVFGQDGYIYVTSGSKSGHMKLSDFPGIDYLMTQYHYYDQGYNIRFGSASTKIYDYASVLNDVMMKNFNLKVCPYVSSYTSAADQCKIWRYGSVYSGNLSSSCPQNGNHKTDSCLQTGYLRNELKKQFGNGGGTISKVAWTGHIMSDYEADRSNATVGMGTVIITPYATTNPNNNFSNYASDKIRRESLYTIVHETGHQLNLHDHYCKKDFSEQTGKCTNDFCVTCNKLPYSDSCIMLDRINVETANTSKIYCDYCKNTINIYLSNKF